MGDGVGLKTEPTRLTVSPPPRGQLLSPSWAIPSLLRLQLARFRPSMALRSLDALRLPAVKLRTQSQRDVLSLPVFQLGRSTGE